MSTLTETTTEKEALTTFVRGELDFLQSRMNEIAHVFPKNELREGVSSLRECITIQKKHYPKIEHIYPEIIRTDIRKIVMLIETNKNTGQPEPVEEISKLRALLHFPENFNKNFADMYIESFEPFDVWKAKKTARLQAEHEDDFLFVIDWDEKIEAKWRKQYEKEKKEWEKQHD